MASHVIAIATQKGGAGKTTLTMQLAAALNEQGRSIAVLDLDPQESAQRWAEAAPAAKPFPATVRGVAPDENRWKPSLKELRKAHDVVLLDCPPSIDHPATFFAIDFADLVIIPVVPSPMDLWSARAMEKLILSQMPARPGLRAVLLPNRVQRTSLSADVMDVLKDFALPVLNQSVSQRNAYAQSAVSGASVFQLGRSGEAAAWEIRQLASEILAILGE